MNDSTATHRHQADASINKVGVAIPTLNAGQMWPAFLTALLNQTAKPHRIVVIDSSSADDTVRQAQAAGLEVLQIPRAEFSHGGTRHKAVEHLDDCDIVVFLTQDALLANDQSLAEIVKCFTDPEVAMAYGRQLPHRNATPIETHARLFNYRETSIKKNAASVATLRMKAFFCSNSFSAYRRSTYLKLGGFRSDLFFGEDAEFAARAIQAGYANYYCATSAVHHSHDYSAVKEFKRHFDIGAFHARNEWLLGTYGSAVGEGSKFVSSEFKFLLKHAPWNIPRATINNAAKLMGYKLGQAERFLPHLLKQRIAMSPSFWRHQAATTRKK